MRMKLRSKKPPFVPDRNRNPRASFGKNAIVRHRRSRIETAVLPIAARAKNPAKPRADSETATAASDSHRKREAAGVLRGSFRRAFNG